MGYDVHTIAFSGAGSPPALLDRAVVGLFRDLPFAASAASVTSTGSITAGTGFTTLPTIAPTGGTLTAGVTPANPAVVRATSLTAITAVPLTAGLGVAINDTFTLSGGTVQGAGPTGNGTATAGAATLVTATHLKVMTAVVNAGGTGGTNGAVTITGTTGTGTKFQATGTIAGNALTGPLVVTVAGDYTVAPTIAGDAITGGSLTGATVTLVMGVLTLALTTPGGYTVAPPTANTPTNGTGTGTGVTVTAAFGLGGAQVINSGNYSVAPSWTVTPTDGNGTGASIATGTLGGNGNGIAVGFATTMPAAYSMQVTAGIPTQESVAYKSNLGFAALLTPLTTGTTLTAGTVDISIIG